MGKHLQGLHNISIQIDPCAILELYDTLIDIKGKGGRGEGGRLKLSS
jgi:hypothetical protein